MWYYLNNSSMNGPVSFEELVNLINAGVITRQTFVWQTGQMRQMAGEIEALTPYFQFESQPVEQKVEQPPKPKPIPQAVQPESKTPEKNSNVLLDTFCKSTGVGRMEGFSFSGLFSETFSKHSDEEMERYFGVGTPETTPPIQKVKAVWPTPWMFLRLIVLGLIGYFLMWIGITVFQNFGCIPGAIIFGAFAVPLACVIFFYECNILKNVSLYQVIKLFLYGGIFGILFTLIGNSSLLFSNNKVIMAVAAGPIEELAKLLVLILILVAGGLKHKNYILNGLLLGAAVGAGFSAFETAGYAFQSYTKCYEILGDTSKNKQQKIEAIKEECFVKVDKKDLDSKERYKSVSVKIMTYTLQGRGIGAIFTHIIWTAMCAGALWRVKKNQDFKMFMLFNPLFLVVLTVAILFHMSWNYAQLQISKGYTLLVLGMYCLMFFGWTIIFGLIGMGLRQVRQQQQYLATKEAQKQQAD